MIYHISIPQIYISITLRRYISILNYNKIKVTHLQMSYKDAYSSEDNFESLPVDPSAGEKGNP